MFKETARLAHTLPMNGCYSQATPAPGTQQDAKGSRHRWPCALLISLTRRNLTNRILPVPSPLQKKRESQGMVTCLSPPAHQSCPYPRKMGLYLGLEF